MSNNEFYSEYDGNSPRKPQYKDYYEERTLTISETTVAFAKAYLWMFIGCMLTFLVGVTASYFLEYLVETADEQGLSIFMIVFFVSFIAEMILCFIINKSALRRANYKEALLGFIVYSILNGITFSMIFLYFSVSYLCYIFAGVMGYFMILTILTFLFRNSIHKLKTFAYVGLGALAITSILVYLFGVLFLSSYDYYMLVIGVTILGIIVFSVLTLVDIRSMYQLIASTEQKNCASIAAAFSLYLDFINIFIRVLRIVLMFTGGNRKK